MNRNYDSGIKDNIEFFIGQEVENTPAYGLKTLFVVGPQNYDEIIKHYDEWKCEHIYLGANKSFDADIWEKCFRPPDALAYSWTTDTIKLLLSKTYLITLDFNVKHIDWVLEQCYCEYDNFIPQISVEIPYIRQLNYNAVLKIDDTDFKKSNPGVWCHNLHELQSNKTFTPWSEYTKDKIIK